MPICKDMFITQNILIELIGQYSVILCVVIKICHEIRRVLDDCLYLKSSQLCKQIASHKIVFKI